jgi:hypothetical protein
MPEIGFALVGTLAPEVFFGDLYLHRVRKNLWEQGYCALYGEYDIKKSAYGDLYDALVERGLALSTWTMTREEYSMVKTVHEHLFFSNEEDAVVARMLLSDFTFEFKPTQ